MTYRLNFSSYYGTYEYVVKDVNNEQEALEKFCASPAAMNSIVYRTVDSLDREELEELEELMWSYIDSTEFGGDIGMLDTTFLRLITIEEE